jgi:tRNA(Ile)-lysidine synthase
MAASATPPSADPLPPCVAVAYSGGRDSTALLHATLAAAREHGLWVAALHVHHGLSPHADEWLRHCESTCRRAAQRGARLRFAAIRLQGHAAPGESVEAWARRERYRALRMMALEQGASIVLLAHHRRDQAETFLLQALRGAGVAGQAAMPREAVREGIRWVRPWLDLSSEAVQAYVKRYRLKHIEDESNADKRFARSRLRTEVWPVLSRTFPGAERSLAIAANWAQQARLAMAELARIDLPAVAGPQGLNIAAWRELSVPRRSVVLREWLLMHTGSAAPASLVERLMHEADRPGAARWPLADDGEHELRRYRGRLRVVDAAPRSREQTTASHEQVMRVTRSGLLRIDGWDGELRVKRVSSRGVALSRLAAVTVRRREGGEQFQLAPNRPARALKKQYQALGIAAAQRAGPLLYLADQLLFVPGLGIDARAWAQAGEPQVSLAWVPGRARLVRARRTSRER